ncbi:MAG: hypothetical protein LC722_01770 [Actinobacteria bacterium]|nr:hypothetical protein [Actinomycetota bacterium]
MSRSKADELLSRADREPNRLTRHLLVAAALRDALPGDPIVVGGTAQEYWTRAEYHQTDLDLCVAITAESRRVLAGLGFRRSGRHWEVGRRHPVAVEFPEARIDGDEARTVEVRLAGKATVRVIGRDDLYLDRLRQATVAPEAEGIEFHSALAVAAAGFEEIDWRYVAGAIRRTRERDAQLGRLMAGIDRRIRRRVRTELDR